MKLTRALIYLTGILTGAHFLRDGGVILAILIALFPFLTLRKYPWVWWAIEAFLILSAGVWISTTYQLIIERISLGDDWVRMSVILLVVSAIPLIAAWRYRVEKSN